MPTIPPSVTLETRLTRLLGIRTPILSAPMALVAGGELAAAVSRAGGLGLIGGGYGDRRWLRREFAHAGAERVGCGFITWALAKQPDLLDVALEQRPVAVMLSFGDPEPYAAAIKSAGAALICQVGTVAQADRALRSGADVVVAQGTEAGGHSFGDRSTLTLVPEVVDLAAAGAPQTVVVAAGGIGDGRGLAAALMLGAAGVLCGTRFYAAREARTSDAARAAVSAASGDDTCRTGVYDVVRGYDWPAGHAMRVLRNDFTDRWDGSEAELRDTGEPEISRYLGAVRAGDYRVANVTAGEAAGLIRSDESAEAIVRGMTVGAAELLGRHGAAP